MFESLKLLTSKLTGRSTAGTVKAAVPRIGEVSTPHYLIARPFAHQDTEESASEEWDALKNASSLRTDRGPKSKVFVVERTADGHHGNFACAFVEIIPDKGAYGLESELYVRTRGSTRSSGTEAKPRYGGWTNWTHKTSPYAIPKIHDTGEPDMPLIEAPPADSLISPREIFDHFREARQTPKATKSSSLDAFSSVLDRAEASTDLKTSQREELLEVVKKIVRLGDKDD